MSADLLLGFDVGTSSVKSIACDLEGMIVATASSEIPLVFPGAGLCEVDPRSYFDGLRACCHGLARAGADLSRALALAVAAHAETLIPVDERLEPLRPAIVWVDTRSDREADDLVDRFGRDELAARSGQPETIPMWPATKVLWLRRHEPELAAATRWWLQPLDYVVARLTGSVVTDYSEYSSSLLLDIRERRWWPSMLEELELAEAVLPGFVTAGTPLGPLAADVATELALSPRIEVVMGGFDQACTAVGAGNVRPGAISESTGMSLAVVSTVTEPPDPAAPVPCHLHVVPERYFLCAHNPTGGAALAWVLSTAGPELSFADLDRLAAGVAPGADGLVLLPTLSGTATPSFAPEARGVLFGIALHHRLPHLARAALEGVAFTLSQLIAEERRLGVEPSELRSVGGGARSDVWGQIKADVTGLPVGVPAAADHAGALGAAVLAGTGRGVFATIEAGADALVHVVRAFDPDPAAAARYEHARSVHHALYPRLADLFRPETA